MVQMMVMLTVRRRADKEDEGDAVDRAGEMR